MDLPRPAPTSDAFREQAPSVQGSWWVDWEAWLSTRSGPQVPARVPGEGNGLLEPAPGRYVRVRAVP